jgi:hypothetical protein
LTNLLFWFIIASKRLNVCMSARTITVVDDP